ncbi:uncharacterized protein LAESUDRAFT_753203 [Laetiporus sulphureus 93-53]|uniref:Uncharacterized protein n=1 Tax=Laetiporus sulphureus 93-53 TaxID=1314785 RepID=A0A165B7M1_9APHY|nr:uncharacterized protein LAESUDRAFT_753203 [Laetiporus sulphureus 93-53]KZT00430.1 hypothetical protein LAESUDRAFT_753203 [Laetiporus sulphureus 93-53]
MGEHDQERKLYEVQLLRCCEESLHRQSHPLLNKMLLATPSLRHNTQPEQHHTHHSNSTAALLIDFECTNPIAGTSPLPVAFLAPRWLLRPHLAMRHQSHFGVVLKRHFFMSPRQECQLRTAGLSKAIINWLNVDTERRCSMWQRNDSQINRSSYHPRDATRTCDRFRCAREKDKDALTRLAADSAPMLNVEGLSGARAAAIARRMMRYDDRSGSRREDADTRRNLPCNAMERAIKDEIHAILNDVGLSTRADSTWDIEGNLAVQESAKSSVRCWQLTINYEPSGGQSRTGLFAATAHFIPRVVRAPASEYAQPAIINTRASGGVWASSASTSKRGKTMHPTSSVAKCNEAKSSESVPRGTDVRELGAARSRNDTGQDQGRDHTTPARAGKTAR